jgi:serine/threonine-protein kinase
MNQAELKMSHASRHAAGKWGRGQAPAFDVIATASLNLRIPPDRHEYEGRSHSLWFCDAREAGRFLWHETAFMISAWIPRRARQNPFALDPGEEAGVAVGSGMAEFEVAWPFTPLVIGELDDFIDRWAGWFALASQGKLGHPNSIPERPPSGSWRRA